MYLFTAILFLLISRGIFSSISESANTSTAEARICEPGADTVSDEENDQYRPVECNEFCQCHKKDGYFFDEIDNKCLKLVYETENKYNVSETLKEEAQKVFTGFLGAAAFFVVASIICVVSALAYCIRIVCTDTTLKRNVKALEKKQIRTGASRVGRTGLQSQTGDGNCCVMVPNTGFIMV